MALEEAQGAQGGVQEVSGDATFEAALHRGSLLGWGLLIVFLLFLVGIRYRRPE